MARVLLTWELGAGLGHLGRLAPVARHLSSRGHRVDLASRTLKYVDSLFGDSIDGVYQAPHHPATRGEGIMPTLGFIHILHNVGHDTFDSLHVLVRAWLTLFEAAKPDLVIADYSPTVLLAAHIAGVPSMTLGNGFEHPMPGQPCPLFWDTLTPEQTNSVERSEREILKNMNDVLARYGNSPLAFVSDIFGFPEQSLLATLPVLDHLGPRDGMKYYGLVNGSGGQQPVWPTKKKPKVYAYLKPSPCLPALFKEMTKLGLNTLVYQNNLGREVVEKSASACVKFTDERLDLGAVVEQADIALTNATHATLGELLAGGVPCVMGPLHPEQRTLAMRIQDYGAGVVVDYRDEKHIVGGLQHILKNDSFRIAAKKYAAEHAHIDQAALDREMFATIDAVVQKNA